MLVKAAIFALVACGAPRATEPSRNVVVEADASHRQHADEYDVHIKNYVMDEDDAGARAPSNHRDLLYGPYLDKKTGKPLIGWHSHDPVTGNAR
jgi:hypothetical protein